MRVIKILSLLKEPVEEADMYICMYVYEDSNSGFFRLPNVYVYAHKWLEHQLLGQSLPVSNFTVCY